MNDLGTDKPQGKVLLVVDEVKAGFIGEGEMPTQVAGLEKMTLTTLQS